MWDICSLVRYCYYVKEIGSKDKGIVFKINIEILMFYVTERFSLLLDSKLGKVEIIVFKTLESIIWDVINLTNTIQKHL